MLVPPAPIDILEERLDVLRGRGSVVERVGVLVHVEHEQRLPERAPHASSPSPRSGRFRLKYS